MPAGVAFRQLWKASGYTSVTDTFDRANTSAGSGLGTTSDGQELWFSQSGDWNINSNKPVTSTAFGSNPFSVIRSAGSPNVDIVVRNMSESDCIYFRVTDASNWWRVRKMASAYTVFCSVFYYNGSCPCDGGPCSPPTYSGGCGGCTGACYDCCVPSCTATGSVCSSYACGTGYNYYYYLEKNVGGTITQVSSVSATNGTRSTRVVANGTTITVYDAAAGTATPSTQQLQSTGQTSHQAATWHGIGRGPSDLNNTALDYFTLAVL